ncbi:MAG: hypothetical protein ACI85N_001291 [Gammaproteobacteria bacterium]|jgi:hypothetical protein
MNELLRILDKALKKRGYAIKKHTEYNLLPLKSFEGFDIQKSIYTSFNKNHERNLNPSSDVGKLEVCLRTCINDKRAKGKRSDLTGVSLEDHLMTCINSLIISVNDACDKNLDIRFTVIDDRSDAHVLDKIRNLCSALKCNWEVIATEEPGQGPSLHETFSLAKGKDSLFYFCEDDYLHSKDAISEMISFYQKVFCQTKQHLLIHPQEHESIYSQFSYPSYIVLGENRRWRTMSHATHTFFVHSSVVNEYWHYFENTKYMGLKNSKLRHLGSEKKTTDRLFKHVPGFSPIPAVAVHLQELHCLPPFFNWRELWEEQEGPLKKN